MLSKVFEITGTTPIESYEKGVAAKFTRIDDKWGIKLYRNEYMRDKTYRFQDLAHSIGCAPSLGDKFKVVLPDDREYHGYITECISETFLKRHLNELGLESKSDLSSDEYYNILDEMEDDEEFKILCEEINSIGISTNDMHASNVGYLPNGKLVAIDFSHEHEE